MNQIQCNFGIVNTDISESFDACQIVLKIFVFCVQSCVGVFKSLSVLEKSVDKCKISLQPDEDRIIFQLYCHHGITFCSSVHTYS